MRVLNEQVTWRKPKAALAQRLTPDLTPDEVAAVRRVLQVLRRRSGSWALVAEELRLNVKTLKKVAGKNGKPSAGIALRAARAVGLPMEDILRGLWPKEGACILCGRCG